MSRIPGNIAAFARGRRDLFGIPILFGKPGGCHSNHAWFGKLTGSPPDGRHAGERRHFGFMPIGGHDRRGMTAVLTSVVKMPPPGMRTGSYVFNLKPDPNLMEDPGFGKTIRLIETCFRLGDSLFR